MRGSLGGDGRRAERDDERGGENAEAGGAVRLAGALALLTLASAVCGCQSISDAAHPDVPQWLTRPSASLGLVYTQRVVASSREGGVQYERGGLALDTGHRRVFVGSRDSGLYALRAVDGRILWRFETLGAVQSEPLYEAREDVVYFGSSDGALYKVRAADGALIWRFATNAEVSRRPVLEEGVLYVVNANDTVVAVRADSGAQVWFQHRTPAMGMEIAGHAAPLVWRGLVHCAFSDGTVTAFDARSGEERWAPVDLSASSEQALDHLPKYLDVDTTPVAGSVERQDAVFVASYEGGVYALNADTGSQLWGNSQLAGVTALRWWSQPSHPARGGGPPVAERTLLVASSGIAGLYGLDPQTGEEVWHTPVPHAGVSAVVPLLGALMFTTTTQGLFLASPLDGRIIDGLHTGSGFAGAPAVYGNRAFALSNAGNLYSLEISSPID